jgi:hypothetical protein
MVHRARPRAAPEGTALPAGRYPGARTESGPEAVRARVGLLFAASLLIQLALCALPDSMGDLLGYRVWARTLASQGLAGAYWPPGAPGGGESLTIPVDYPPFFPYLLLFIGRACGSCSDAVLESVIRFPLVLANLATGFLILRAAWRIASPNAAIVAAAFFLFNPAVIFDTCYWGQADSLCALLLTLAAVELTRRPQWAWACLALAVLTKPLAYPFVPLAMVVTLKRFGWRRGLGAGAAFTLCFAAAVLPFATTGHLGPLLRSLFVQLDAMPYLSVNAHNLWWLVQRGTPWIDAREKVLGWVSYGRLGIGLFAAFYAWTLVRAWHSRDETAPRVAFASVALGFFVLSTHMHENHLFNFLPLVLLAGPVARRARIFFVAASCTMLANMLLHDPSLTSLVRPFVPGPHLVLPEVTNVDPAFFDHFLALGYGSMVELVRGKTSLLGVVFTALNSQLNVLLFAAWILATYTGRSFDGVLQDGPRRRLPPSFAPAALVFVVATIVPFLSHALRASPGKPRLGAVTDSRRAGLVVQASDQGREAAPR